MLKRKYEMLLMWKEKIDNHHREMNSTFVGEDAKLYKDLQVDYDSDVKVCKVSLPIIGRVLCC